MVGLKHGALEDKLALYADDLLLFLENPGPSLQEALSIIERFGTYSGLTINKSKSVIFPIDEIPTHPIITQGLKWVNRFK